MKKRIRALNKLTCPIRADLKSGLAAWAWIAVWIAVWISSCERFKVLGFPEVGRGSGERAGFAHGEYAGLVFNALKGFWHLGSLGDMGRSRSNGWKDVGGYWGPQVPRYCWPLTPPRAGSWAHPGPINTPVSFSENPQVAWHPRPPRSDGEKAARDSSPYNRGHDTRHLEQVRVISVNP